MTDADIRLVCSDFHGVARVAGAELPHGDLVVEYLAAPHIRPRSLPTGMMAVYVFGIGEQCLKVGKAGPKTVQRYTYQHYNPGSAPSTLAASILRHVTEDSGPLWPNHLEAPTEQDVGAWIERNAWRANLLLPATRSPFLLNLLESFIQCRLRPAFEGAAKVGAT